MYGASVLGIEEAGDCNGCDHVDGSCWRAEAEAGRWLERSNNEVGYGEADEDDSKSLEWQALEASHCRVREQVGSEWTCTFSWE